MMEFNNRIKVAPLKSKLVKDYSFKAFQVLFLAVVLILTYTPILVMILTSFSTDPLGYRFNSFTFDWYKELIANDDLLDSIIFTLEITVLSTLISTVFGTISAIGINALSKNLKKKFIQLITI